MATGAASERRRAAIAAYNTGDLARAAELLGRCLAEPGHDIAAQADLHKLLGLVLYGRQRHQEALEHILQAHALTPEDYETVSNLAVLYRETGQLRLALDWVNRALAMRPDDFVMHDTAAHLLGQAGSPLFREAGRNALSLKHKAVMPEETHHPLPAPDWAAVRARKKVIAFSLWGKLPRYLNGALANASARAHLYPDWVCRFYCGESVPAEVRRWLVELGAEVVLRPEPSQLYTGLFWRFAVANDPEVGLFLVRDADSLLNIRERVAVDDWLESGAQPFHLMRDNASHTELILAGLWGGVAGLLPDLAGLASPYLERRNKTRNIDQVFLREQVWPLIWDRHLAHDEAFGFGSARPFPRLGRLPPGQHVGQNAAIRPWPPMPHVVPEARITAA